MLSETILIEIYTFDFTTLYFEIGKYSMFDRELLRTRTTVSWTFKSGEAVIFIIFIFTKFLLIEMEAATPAESARTEDPGLSVAKEAAEVLPAESVRCNGNHHSYYFSTRKGIQLFGYPLFYII